MTKGEHIQAWKRFVTRLENIYTPKFNAAIKAQFETFYKYGKIEAIDSGGIAKVLRQLRKESALNWGARINRELRQIIAQKNRRPMGFSERIYELMRDYFGIDLLNDAEGITDTTREYIRIALSNAARNGTSFDDMVAQMKKDVPDLSAMRASRIARTETVASANKASLTVAKDAGVKLNKKWLSVHDKITRHTHIEADNQQVPIDTPFEVGGFKLDFPGDRGNHDGRLDVPGSLTVNCRCTTSYEGVRDSNGRLVRI